MHTWFSLFLQEQTTRVRTEHAALQAQLSSTRTNVDRLTLRLEDAQTVLGEKERLYGELQQEKATLKTQVEKWKSLDDRGGAEAEELHKQRAALESQVKRLESRLAEEQNKVLAHEKAIQKEHKKVEKLQLALEEQVVRPPIEILNITSLKRASLIAYCRGGKGRGGNEPT
jgi:chromosome segregation ATPase